jgi:Protein of unknown function (DUF3396)
MLRTKTRRGGDVSSERDPPADFDPTELTSGVPVAWVTQGVLLYVRDFGLAPGQLLSTWDDVMDSGLGSELRHYRYWHETAWQPLAQAGLSSLRAELQASIGQPYYWRFNLANRPVLPDVSLEIVSVPPTLGRDRASYVRIGLPVTASAGTLLALTSTLADRLPFWAGTAGFLFNPVESEWRAAFDQIWAWSRRYWAIEVADTRAGSWDVLGGLLNVNWLTLIGRDLIQMLAKEERSVRLKQPPAELRVHETMGGAMLQAGPAPLLGDLNRFEDWSAYSEAARLLEPALIAEPTAFAGMFADHVSTLSWTRRFLAPNAWLDPDRP